MLKARHHDIENKIHHVDANSYLELKCREVHDQE